MDAQKNLKNLEVWYSKEPGDSLGFGIQENLKILELRILKNLEILEVLVFKRTWRFLRLIYLREPGDF